LIAAVGGTDIGVITVQIFARYATCGIIAGLNAVTDIAVIADYWCCCASSSRIARIGCAGIAIIADYWCCCASSIWIARIGCAGIAVIADYRFICASGRWIAGIGCAGIAVVAGRRCAKRAIRAGELAYV
jgi:hypothetical protein